MKNNGIHLTWIVVANLDEAIKFYTEILGFTLNAVAKEYGWAEVSGPNGSKLGLAQQNDRMSEKAGSNAVVTIVVDDIQNGRSELQQKGVQLFGDVMEIPGEVKLQSFADKDGNQFQLVELVRPNT